MGTPQIVYLAIVFLDIIVTAIYHGKEISRSRHVSITLSLFVVLGLLAWGGFFSHGVRFPQILMCILLILSYFVNLFQDEESIKKHMPKQYNVFSVIVSKSIMIIILYAGGFFGGGSAY
jgi:hypothetical protein